MKRVKDPQGHIIKGVFKDTRGALIVDDPRALQAYRAQQDAINNVNQRVNQLIELVQQLQKAVEIQSGNNYRKDL